MQRVNIHRPASRLTWSLRVINMSPVTIDDLDLRDANEEDFDLLYRLHRDTLKPYVRDARAWDEAWQLENFRQHFNPENQRIIRHEGRDIGSLSLHDHETFLLLDNIALAPELRNQGIGTIVIREVLDLAKRRAIPVRLNVLKANRAAKLYERLGFVRTGDDQHRYFMEATAGDGTA